MRCTLLEWAASEQTSHPRHRGFHPAAIRQAACVEEVVQGTASSPPAMDPTRRIRMILKDTDPHWGPAVEGSGHGYHSAGLRGVLKTEQSA